MKQGSDIKFVYTIYIAASPEKVWEALTGSEYSQKYWFGSKIEGDWKVGGGFKFLDPNGELLVIGKILKCEKPHILSYTWELPPTFKSIPPELKARLDKSKEPTRVTYSLKQMKDLTRLTLLHEDLLPEDFIENPDTFVGLNNGWPAIFSSLKSLLETGKALQF
ncbi:SRPBCC family protein [Leptospira dzoumogneensis]|uniref:Activator of Hsp90 ATPase homologue 1/2-like C-terminal domain-containing protein n=1 Tax=Leptospira dzoumogneensis TaxID=2484904 RepID=A0A4Z1AQV4_9LEPT|nr:SRPBCC family protein [Leptospira dzoumogneensis]TGN04130.1 hypothetical protein EHR06_00140 [Leptospira dzoumogneensis]